LAEGPLHVAGGTLFAGRICGVMEVHDVERRSRPRERCLQPFTLRRRRRCAIGLAWIGVDAEEVNRAADEIVVALVAGECEIIETAFESRIIPIVISGNREKQIRLCAFAERAFVRSIYEPPEVDLRPATLYGLKMPAKE